MYGVNQIKCIGNLKKKGISEKSKYTYICIIFNSMSTCPRQMSTYPIFWIRWRIKKKCIKNNN